MVAYRFSTYRTTSGQVLFAEGMITTVILPILPYISRGWVEKAMFIIT